MLSLSLVLSERGEGGALPRRPGAVADEVMRRLELRIVLGALGVYAAFPFLLQFASDTNSSPIFR